MVEKKSGIKSCPPWERPDIKKRAAEVGMEPRAFWRKVQNSWVTKESTSERETCPQYLDSSKLLDPTLPAQGMRVFNPHLSPEKSS